MSSFLLRPENSEKDIEIPFGRTTIGRGPFLGVTDKRVSRSHAVLEVNDGKLTVLPLHTNPTFYKSSEKEKFVSLKKDETKVLMNSDVIALLPDSLCFKVCQENSSKNDAKEEQAEIPRNEMTDDLPSISPVTDVNDEEKPLKPSKIPTESLLDEFLDDRPSLRTFSAAVTQDADVNIGDSKNSTEDTADESSSSILSKKETISPSKPSVAPAPLLQKTRKLPSWLIQSASETKSPAKKAGNKRGKTPASQDTEKKPAAANKERRKTTQKATPTSPTKEKRKISDKDEDFIASDDDEEDEHLQQKVNGKCKKKRTSTSIENSDEDIQPTASKKTKPKPKSKSESESDDENEPVQTKSEKDVNKPFSRDSDSVGSDEDETSVSKRNEKGKSPGTDKGKAKLPPCPYGKTCYRKNPLHFKEYSHSDEESNNDDDDKAAADDSDDDRPVCPYGSSCYRRNPQHKKDFKHTDTIGRPKRKTTKKKSVLDGTSDDEGPNTYDYNDSFLADDASDVEESGGSYSGSDDSDWQPARDDNDDDDEDVNELLHEARGFLRNTKMTKPV